MSCPQWFLNFRLFFSLVEGGPSPAEACYKIQTDEEHSGVCVESMKPVGRLRSNQTSATQTIRGETRNRTGIPRWRRLTYLHRGNKGTQALFHKVQCQVRLKGNNSWRTLNGREMLWHHNEDFSSFVFANKRVKSFYVISTFHTSPELLETVIHHLLNTIPLHWARNFYCIQFRDV